MECTDNVAFKPWGIVDTCEIRTLKFNMGLVNFKLRARVPLYPFYVTFTIKQ